MKELVYPRLLRHAAERHASKVGFVDGDFRGTYGHHMDRVARLCSALRSLGLRKADRFAVLALNSHRFLELYHAAFLGAGVITPLNIRLAAKELEYILQDSGTRVCFVDASYAHVIEQIRKTVRIDHVVLMGSGECPHDLKYEQLIAAEPPRFPDEPEESDPVVLMYTGGTTGLPKGVVCDQRAEMLNVYHVLMRIKFEESMVYLHQVPMFHAASMFAMLAMPLGATSVFIPMFDPAKCLALMEKEGVTYTLMVPTMIAMMLNQPAFEVGRLASLRQLVYGASPMPAALLGRLMALKPDLQLYQGYGMTEASSVLTLLEPEDHRTGGDVLRSAGRPVPGVELTIQDEKGEILPPGAIGEVCARSGNFMRNYWNNAEPTEEAFRGGWYHTGDAAYLDERGYLYLVDRVKDMIVTGGENVYSIEVENAIAAHPAVAQVAVIGIPHDTWGESVHAIVVLRPGQTAAAEELTTCARQAIAGYKVPKSIEFRTDPLPLSGAMKVLKRELRAPFWREHVRRVN